MTTLDTLKAAVTALEGELATHQARTTHLQAQLGGLYQEIDTRAGAPRGPVATRLREPARLSGSARLVRDVIRDGHQTIPAIAKAAKLPVGKVRTVIKTLETHGVVQRHGRTSATTFTAQ